MVEVANPMEKKWLEASLFSHLILIIVLHTGHHLQPPIAMETEWWEALEGSSDVDLAITANLGIGLEEATAAIVGNDVGVDVEGDEDGGNGVGKLVGDEEAVGAILKECNTMRERRTGLLSFFRVLQPHQLP